MLKFFTLETIYQIFKGVADFEVSEMSKLVYMNCLIHHFKDKEPTLQNANAFELYLEDSKFNQFKANFIELEKANLIQINKVSIAFNNTWGKHIERAMLTKKEIRKDLFKLRADALIGNTYMIEVVCMKTGLSKAQIPSLVELFVKEQIAVSKQYENESDATKHFIFWTEKNTHRAKLSGIAKSKGKLLAK